MFGNKALRSSDYENFRFIKQLEAGMIADKLVGQAKKRHIIVNIDSLKSNKIKYNLVQGYLNMKIALAIWKEYFCNLILDMPNSMINLVIKTVKFNLQREYYAQ